MNDIEKSIPPQCLDTCDMVRAGMEAIDVARNENEQILEKALRIEHLTGELEHMSNPDLLNAMERFRTSKLETNILATEVLEASLRARAADCIGPLTVRASDEATGNTFEARICRGQANVPDAISQQFSLILASVRVRPIPPIENS